MRRMAATVALLAAAGGAQAGGFQPVTEAPAPVVVPTPAMARALDIGGAVWGDIGRFEATQTDDGSDDGPLELEASSRDLGGAVEVAFGRVVLGADAYSLRRDLGDPEVEGLLAPDFVRASGLHLGTRFGGLRLGAFYGTNAFTGYNEDPEDFYEVDEGRVKGLEMEYAFADGFAVFAQAGRANLVSTEDDVEFNGDILRVGASGRVGRLGGAVDFERGSTDDFFPDEGDSGSYRGWSVRADYHVTDRISVNASYDSLSVETDPETEGDTAEESTLSLGVTFAFGGASSRPNLVTPWRPGLVTSWAEALD